MDNVEKTIRDLINNKIKLDIIVALLSELKGLDDRRILIDEALQSINNLLYSNSVMITKQKLNMLAEEGRHNEND